ncbi:MAG: hypothetical protein O7C59_11800, partial [Rickettsia endosymbiont of Ixodes persulcatus]|nr:hypothetical protein [Rickettsia endosymbiont of Ixodes persulcatus]
MSTIDLADLNDANKKTLLIERLNEILEKLKSDRDSYQNQLTNEKTHYEKRKKAYQNSKDVSFEIALKNNI